MPLWDKLTDLIDRNATQYLYAPIPADRVVGASYDAAPHQAGRDYFRLWLADMFLSKDKQWFANRHPAVNALTRFQFGDQQVDIPIIAGPLRLGDVSERNLNRSIRLDYPLTTLMPYNGGVVDLTAALLAMKGGDTLQRFLTVMGDFSALLAVPQLSAALAVARPVADGIEQLLGAQDATLHLAYHQAFADLRPGYIAVVLAPQRQLPAERLWVKDSRLHTGAVSNDLQPLEGYDYLLLNIEKRAERDDFEGLTDIKEAFDEALSSLGEAQPERAESYLRTAVVLALKSIDLTRADRRRVAEALKARYDEAKDLGLGAVEAEKLTFTDLVRRTGTPEAALVKGRLDPEALFQ